MGVTLQLADGQIVGAFQVNADGEPVIKSNSTSYVRWGGSIGLSYERLYRTQPWVAACINILTRQIARLPLKPFQRDSQGTKQRVTSGPLYDALQRPADRHGPVNLKQWLAFPALLHGNSTTLKVRSRPGGPVVGFRPLRWGLMTPYELNPGSDEIDYWVTAQLQDRRVLQPEDVLHIAWMPPSGVVGVSPLEQLGVTLLSEINAQRYVASIYRHAARPSGGVTLPEAVAGDKEFRRELRDDLRRLHEGVENAGRPIILPPGSQWQSFGISARDAELIDSRKISREEIAAVYHAPQPLIGILDHATYSNVAELHKILYGPVLGPWTTLIEEAFNAQVIDNEPEFEGQFVEFDLSEVLSGDPLKEATALKTQLQTGLLTINEARQIRNLPTIDHPDCDRPMIPANNVSFVGGGDGQDRTEQDPAAAALARNLDRLAERAYRRTKAGEPDTWDPERFRRELRDDLKAARDPNYDQTAKTWTGVLTAVISEALGDAEALRAGLAALNPKTAAGGA